MELCAIRALSNLPIPHNRLITNPVHHHSRYASLLKRTRLNSVLRYYKNSALKSTTSENTSVDLPLYVKDEPSFESTTSVKDEPSFESTTSVKDEPSIESTTSVKDDADGVVAVEEARPVENNEEYKSTTLIDEKPREDSLVDNPLKAFELLENFDIKFDSEDTYSILAFGGGALIAVWVASAVVGAIDSIPVFPKVLELVGLAYTLWFSTRYLIFKENREELFAKLEQLKEQVIGLKDE